MTRIDIPNRSPRTRRRLALPMTALGRVATAYSLLAVIASGTALAQPARPIAAPFDPIDAVDPVDPIESPTAAALVSDEAAPVRDDKRSPDTAWWLSLGGTLLASGLSVAAVFTESRVLAGFAGVGVTIAPSAGQYYAGAPGRATLAALVRGVGSAAVLYGLNKNAADDCSGHCEERGTFLIVIGSGFALGAAAWSIADAPNAARRHNRRRAIDITPAPIAGPDGSVGAGLQLGWRFP